MPRAILIAIASTLAALAQGPQPPVVDPGKPGQPPSDAVVLIRDNDSSEWVQGNDQPSKWPVENGVMTCKTGSGDVRSKRKFGSAQIHVEFAEPYMPEQKGQMRGNSGVYIQGRYEVQVLDSYQNPTYANGSAGALYSQYAPLVNASRPPTEWQTYDIIFHAPKCTDGKMSAPGSLTILHNGVLIQDHVAVQKPTPGADPGSVCDPGPLRLQDHYDPHVPDTPLRFRNIWVRPLD